MTRDRAVALGSLSALVGGLCWVVKGGWILVTGWQPSVIYEVAPLFFPVAVGALFVVPGVGPPEWQPTGSTVTVLTPSITLSALGTFVSLVLLGVPVRRARALPGWRRNLPLLIGVGAIPALAVGGLLELMRTHLIEVSTVAIGLGWVALAVALRRVAPAKVASSHPIAPL